jgi:ribonuclease HII
MSLAHLGAEAYRLQLLMQLEYELRAAGFASVAGVDEAGRGSLAGPVVAAAVIPDPERMVPGVDDSKRLSPGSREELAARIEGSLLAVRVVVKPADLIDRINVLQATRQAMREALTLLDPAPDVAVVDAVSLEGLPFPVLPVVRGDAVSYAVACASILAKVARDRLMCELHREHPVYGFDRNKGYGAPDHLQALATFGPCTEHRLTFGSVLPSRRSG